MNQEQRFALNMDVVKESPKWHTSKRFFNVIHHFQLVSRKKER